MTVDWSQTKLCSLCGTECPKDIRRCFRCASANFSLPQDSWDAAQRIEHRSKSPTGKLIQLLGISDLRAGCHILRNERDRREDKVWVTHLWHARIMPSFHDWALLGLAEFKESEFNGQHHPACMAAAIVAFEQGSAILKVAERAEIQSDPLREAVRSVDLMPERQAEYLDGIGYTIDIAGTELATSLRLSNPTQPGLVAIESALLLVCERILEATRSKDLKVFLKTTRRYTK